MAGQRAQIAVRIDKFRVAEQFVGPHGHAREIGMAVQEGFHLFASFLALQRAHREDEKSVHRIANLYRENARFRDSANAYIEEFEALLSHAREGDGGGGLLASTILSADTGKIYLAIAYALGRL